MKKWHKITLSILGVIVVAIFSFYKIYLSPNYVAQPNLSSNLEYKSIAINEVQRDFYWYAPQKTNTVNSILYVLHGSRSNGIEVRKSFAYEFDKIADEEGLIVVYPNGYDNHWNDCRSTADYSANALDVDDFVFFQHLESLLATELNINLQYRFATGHSNGGHMCYKLALENPDWIDAIAPISASLPIDINLDCVKKEQFVPLCVINGTADPINPYNGGIVEILGNTSRGSVLSTVETMNYWMELRAEEGDCLSPMIMNLEDKVVEDKSTIEQTMWTCGGKIQAVHYKVLDGGHVIPHPQNQLPKILGTTNKDLNAPQAIWAFFKQVRGDYL